MGESAKRKNKDADTIQSCKDDKDLLNMFMHTACNALVTAVALRFPYISYTIDEGDIEIEFETEDDQRSHLLPALQYAITDYLVNEALLQWMQLRSPELAQIYLLRHASLYNNALFMFAKMYNSKRTRRRATDLAGI